MSRLYSLSAVGMFAAAVISICGGRWDTAGVYLLGAVLIVGLDRVSELLEALKDDTRGLVVRHLALAEELAKLRNDEEG